MKINIREDSVEIEGYVNAVERNSKPLPSRMGQFIERICKGAFSKALKRNDDIHILSNHDWSRDLGSTKQGNLELTEDNIGLRARAVISDPETVEDARQGNLIGWSFGFWDTPDGVEKGTDGDTGLPLRKVRDMVLTEVSILNRKRCPAYDGTLVMVRDDSEEVIYAGAEYLDDIETIEETIEKRAEEQEQPQQEHAPEADNEIDYSEYEEMIKEMKGE